MRVFLTTIGAMALVLPFAFTNPAIAADDAMSIATQINQKWIAASDKGDAAGFVALYAKGASVLPHGAAEPIIGEANIHKFFDGMAAGPKPENFKITVSEAMTLDPKTMFANGTYAANRVQAASVTHCLSSWPTRRRAHGDQGIRAPAPNPQTASWRASSLSRCSSHSL